MHHSEDHDGEHESIENSEENGGSKVERVGNSSNWYGELVCRI